MEGPFVTPRSPAVWSACVASRGRWSRRTEAARVMGRVESCSSCSSWFFGESGPEEGEGDVVEAVGEGEAMVR